MWIAHILPCNAYNEPSISSLSLKSPHHKKQWNCIAGIENMVLLHLEYNSIE